MTYYTYTNQAGQEITVYLISDCGMVNGKDGKQWHKVLCKPIGFANSPVMSLDKNSLVKA